ncbi:glycosyltransferase [Bifidobacterium pseudolongum]|uniref:Glycosyl transferase family 2 n=1 Tax=Bifidobacterium pseudolongum subsp. globosum TaxID=1690 RepID=A0A4Q5A4U6_9BIFI|nr:glycosyltransferase [Bifidobacterium pseudolongum]RYQ16768.1 glycosyl transferase family 2 [Bifidobacterium pseudolongum subsp. globosum]RYQ30315.1 glycosyl transferase family 2 [Bifidobacterium pseudolongum subsp. globosum]RYQ34736.1 glycosyl transferase family 2 [Bifidobacterium pseudolongum subsp. globosum]
MRELPPFTLLMSVYGGNTLRELERAVQSGTIEQTLPPAQLVIVRDGPVSDDIQRYLDSLPSTMAVWFAVEHPDMPSPTVTVVPLSENHGLAHALNVGLEHCTYEYIARADCDDVSMPNRFATVIPQFVASSRTASHARTDGSGTVDVLGSAIREFNDDEREPGQVRLLPAEGAELAKYARLQSPIHHPSVVFRKSAVIAAGGYPEDAGRFEDYMLWERMMLNHAQFLNVPEPLVLYRTNKEAYERRGGLSMFVEECKLQWRFMRDGFTTPLQFLRNVAVRAVYRLTPMSIRKRAYHAIVARRNGALTGGAQPQTEQTKRGRHSAPPAEESSPAAVDRA